MFNENNCLENLKHIVSEYADDENIKNLSLDELRSSYMKIADNMYSVSVSNRLKYKNMLCNINNLKPEIRSKFQAELFNTWNSIHMKSIKTDPTEDRSEIKKQTSLSTEQPTIKSEKQNRMASSQDTDLSPEMKPAKEQSPVTVPKASAHQFENDWFDKFLDFVAAIIGGVSGMICR